MQSWRAFSLLIGGVLLASCGPPLASGADRGGAAERPRATKQITAAVLSDPPVLTGRLTFSSEPGLEVLKNLTNPGFAIPGPEGRLRPVLVEQVPSIENGFWTVLPDGRMETTWKLRPDIFWHDGTPFTAEDVLFTHRVIQDPEVDLTPTVAYRSVESIESPDPRTVVVRWKQPFIEADTALDDGYFPRHHLEKAYLDSKHSFNVLSYWGGPIVGVGPYRVGEWVRGSGMRLEAYDRYVLGRPRIDLIDVKFIPDPNALIANILSGSVEVTFGKTLTVEHGVQLMERWGAGRMELTPSNSLQMFPQLLTPNPALVGDVEFRQALFYAIDRQEIANSLLFGLGTLVHSYLGPSEPPEFQAVADQVVQHPYDPRRAEQLLRGLGLSRAPDGMLQDGAGRRLSVEIRTITSDSQRQAMLAVADYWQQVGVAAEPVVIPRAQAQDAEYRATFPGFEMVRNSADQSGLKRL